MARLPSYPGTSRWVYASGIVALIATLALFIAGHLHMRHMHH